MKKKIPKALRQQTWVKYIGNNYTSKCFIDWCANIITPFNFEVGHNLPSSKGGSDNITNLRPICSQCNRSMGNQYTIDEFIDLGGNCKNKSSKEVIKISENKSTIFLSIYRCFGCVC